MTDYAYSDSLGDALAGALSHVRRDAPKPPVVDPQSLMDDPHARFAALRARHAVVQFRESQYLVLRAADVMSLISDARTRQVEGAEFVGVNRIPYGITARFLSELFLFSNGHDHRTKRGLFARTFAHRAMRDLRAPVRRVADGIVADLPRGESIDFIQAMAARVPAEMTAAILGLPVEDAPYFASRVYDVARAFTTVYPEQHHEVIENATGELFDYVEDQLIARLDTPRDDFLSALAADWRADPVISLESLVFQVAGLVVGGSDTTRAAFAMLVSLLAQRPADWAVLRALPDLIPGAVAEALRYEPSVGSIPRRTTAPVQIGEFALPAGSVLTLSTMSAMRDPDLYAEPDRFNIRRTDHPRLHTVFGLGPHRCIGEMLARVELEEGLAALLDGVSAVEVETAPKMTGFGGIRQISPMRVRLR